MVENYKDYNFVQNMNPLKSMPVNIRNRFSNPWLDGPLIKFPTQHFFEKIFFFRFKSQTFQQIEHAGILSLQDRRISNQYDVILEPLVI